MKSVVLAVLLAGSASATPPSPDEARAETSAPEAIESEPAGAAGAAAQELEPRQLEPEPPPPLRLEDVWARQGADAVLAEAVGRRSVGDFQGADDRLAWLQQAAPGPEATYHAAVSAELQERYDESLAGYEAVLSSWPGDPRAVDAGFRRALVLEDLGRHQDALRQVRALQRSGDWSARDEHSLALARGVNELGQGRIRRGLRRLDKSLTATEDTDDLAWMRAKARVALARHLLAEADGIPMVHGRRASRNLEARAAAISGAERQVIAVAKLGEAEYALAGLELLGDAYLALHDDIVALPPPEGLSASQAAIYREGIAQKSDVLRRKAWRYYDEGVKLATRTEWQGAIVERLRGRRDGLEDAAP